MNYLIIFSILFGAGNLFADCALDETLSQMRDTLQQLNDAASAADTNVATEVQSRRDAIKDFKDVCLHGWCYEGWERLKKEFQDWEFSPDDPVDLVTLDKNGTDCGAINCHKGMISPSVWVGVDDTYTRRCRAACNSYNDLAPKLAGAMDAAEKAHASVDALGGPGGSIETLEATKEEVCGGTCTTDDPNYPNCSSCSADDPACGSGDNNNDDNPDDGYTDDTPNGGGGGPSYTDGGTGGNKDLTTPPSSPGGGTTPTGGGLALKNAAAPTGDATNKGAGDKGGDDSWYKALMSMYSGDKGAKKDATTGEGVVVGGVGGSGDSGKGTTGGGAGNLKGIGINGVETDIFKVVSKMYQNRYYAGLIGKEVDATKVAEPLHQKYGSKPVIYGNKGGLPGAPDSKKVLKR